MVKEFIQLLQPASKTQYAVNEVTGIALLRNFLKKNDFLIASPLLNNFEQLVEIGGIEHLEASKNSGNGTILACIHDLTSIRLLDLILGKIALGSYMQIVGMAAFRFSPSLKSQFDANFSKDDPEIISTKFLSYQYKMAHDTLLKNRTVRIAADKSNKKNGFEASLFGKKVNLFQGLANLSIDTNAQIIPMTAAIDWNGKIRLKFYPTISDHAAELPAEKRADAIMAEFVSFYANAVLEDPANIKPQKMQRIMNLPDYNPKIKSSIN